MTRIRFDSETALNVPNINALNNVVISPTEPTTGEEVWIQKGKNLIRGFTPGLFYNYSNNIYENGTPFTTSRFINVVVGATYVFSHALNSNGGYVACFDDNDNFLEAINSDKMLTPFTITNANCKKILCVSYDGQGNPSQNETWMQLEQGSTATTYEAYIDKKIYTKNDNGVYEEFYSEEVLNKKYELKSYTNWQKTYVVNYDEYTPVIVVVAWEQSIAAYALLIGRVVELGKSGTDDISYSVDTANRQVTFTLGDTGVFRTISLTQ